MVKRAPFQGAVQLPSWTAEIQKISIITDSSVRLEIWSKGNKIEKSTLGSEDRSGSHILVTHEIGREQRQTNDIFQWADRVASYLCST